MLIDALINEPTKGDKLLWFLVILSLLWVGALIYFFLRKRQRPRLSKEFVSSNGVAEAAQEVNEECAVSRDPNSPQVLTTVATEQEGSLIVSHLDAVGIKAHIWNAGTVSWGEGVPSEYQLVVRQADLEQAKRILDQLKP
jgi:hypothetical protein